MAYRLSRSKSVQKRLRKVAAEQIDRAIREILDDNLPRHEAVHQVRKRCKKLRGLVRLVRPVFDTYADENAFFRDAYTTVVCYDKLLDRSAGVESVELADVRLRLMARREQVAGDAAKQQECLAETLVDLQAARTRVASWRISARGFSAVEGGLLKTYRRGCNALQRAYEHSTAENFHQWRKRVKYHWCHIRLLERTWRPMLGVSREAADELSTLLGDDHDLTVLRDDLLTESDAFGGESLVQRCVGLIDRRRAELREAARPLGERLFAEPPKCLVRRFRRYWKVWRSDRTAQG